MKVETEKPIFSHCRLWLFDSFPNPQRHFGENKIYQVFFHLLHFAFVLTLWKVESSTLLAQANYV